MQLRVPKARIYLHSKPPNLPQHHRRSLKQLRRYLLIQRQRRKGFAQLGFLDDRNSVPTGECYDLGG